MNARAQRNLDATALRSPAPLASAEPIVRLLNAVEPGSEALRRVVHDGLAARPKRLPSMYFYDDRGSELFRRIMSLPEYYLTRAEREILAERGRELVSHVADGGCDVIDLGAGDGVKTQLLLEQLHERADDVRYVPIDVSEHALSLVLRSCREQLPWLRTLGIAADYEQGLAWLAREAPERQRLALLLGSNIGNVDRASTSSFLHMLRRALRPGDHVLVGFDLVKDPDVLQRAYDDWAGVTAEFNLNLLRRINRELDADFDLDAFRHYATFSPYRGAMESYLISVRAQTVTVGDRRYELDAWEPIHTEVSCKYRPSEISAFAHYAGFVEVGHFYDERRLFLDALWRVGERPVPA